MREPAIKIACSGNIAKVRQYGGVVVKLVGDQVDRQTFTLNLAGDAYEPGCQDSTVVALKHFRPDNYVPTPVSASMVANITPEAVPGRHLTRTRPASLIGGFSGRVVRSRAWTCLGASAVNGVDLQIKRGEVVALLGESGSGKSVTLRTLLRLHPEKRTDITGRVNVLGQDVMALKGAALAGFRGKAVSMIFQ